MTDRRPRWVYEPGDEPDPRYTLANERTFLAWVRTALAMVRWARVERAMRTRQPIPAFALGDLLTGAVLLAVAFV